MPSTHSAPSTLSTHTFRTSPRLYTSSTHLLRILFTSTRHRHIIDTLSVHLHTIYTVYMPSTHYPPNTPSTQFYTVLHSSTRYLCTSTHHLHSSTRSLCTSTHHLHHLHTFHRSAHLHRVLRMPSPHTRLLMDGYADRRLPLTEALLRR